MPYLFQPPSFLGRPLDCSSRASSLNSEMEILKLARSGSYTMCVDAVLSEKLHHCIALIFLYLTLFVCFLKSTCLWQLENAVAQHHDLLPSTEVDEPTPKTSAPGHVSHSVSLAS